MDFVNRATPSQSSPSRSSSSPESVTLPVNSGRGDKKHEQKKDFLGMGTTIGSGVLLFVIALMIAALAWLIYSTTPASQGKLVDSKKIQAVFLNNGQAYFGNVQTLNKDYLVLTNVFYLQTANQGSTSSTTTSSNQQISLVKLGCELHMPYDRMIINNAQVTFWENLQDDGQVAKAVAQWDKQNPSGQKCSDQGQAPNGNVQGSSGSSSSSSSSNTTSNTSTTPSSSTH